MYVLMQLNRDCEGDNKGFLCGVFNSLDEARGAMLIEYNTLIEEEERYYEDVDGEIGDWTAIINGQFTTFTLAILDEMLNRSVEF